MSRRSDMVVSLYMASVQPLKTTKRVGYTPRSVVHYARAACAAGASAVVMAIVKICHGRRQVVEVQDSEVEGLEEYVAAQPAQLLAFTPAVMLIYSGHLPPLRPTSLYPHPPSTRTSSDARPQLNRHHRRQEPVRRAIIP